MLHHAIEILADFIEVPDAGDGLHGLLQRLQGPGIVLDDRVSADHAVVADACTRPDGGIGPEEGPLADRGIRMHHYGRMAFAPLSESIALPVEVFQ